MACLAALHAFKAAGQKLPVNIVLVCEGEEEIGSPNFQQIVFKPEVEAALRKCIGVIIPLGNQSLDGSVEINLGAKGVVELELVSSGEKWGRGPKNDVHSSLEAQLDSPSWHLIQALNTLVQADGHTPAVDGFFDKVRPLSARQKQILEAAIPKRNEARNEESARRRPLVQGRAMARLARSARDATDDQHRGTRRRLHRRRRKDDSSAPRRREDRHAARARHDGEGHARAARRSISRSTASATSK